MAVTVTITQTAPFVRTDTIVGVGLPGPQGPSGAIATVNGNSGPAITVAMIGTAAATPSTIPIRDASGRMKAATPSTTDDVANKAYVDSTAGSVSVVNDTLARRDGTGQLYVNTPTTAFAAATKGYVDMAVAFRANRTSPLSVSAATWTQVVMQAESYDLSSNHSLASGFTAPTTGYYEFSWRVGVTVAAAGEILTELRVGGTITSRGTRHINPSSGDTASVGADSIYLTAGQVASLWFYSSASGSIITGSTYDTFFAGRRLL